jgi:HD-like signal output (HDOD) protein
LRQAYYHCEADPTGNAEQIDNMTAIPTAFAFLEEIAAELSKREVVFPTLVDVTFRIRQLLGDPNLSIGRIGKMVAAEPLLAARAIKLANSVAYNPGGDAITDLNKAITLVGLDAVRNLIYSLAMAQLSRSKEMARYHDVALRLWEHSLETAAMAHVIARKCSRLGSDTAMFAGLVHDIGAFYLLYRLAVSQQTFPDHEVMPLVVEWHEEIGYAVLSSLQLPGEIADAIKFHDVKRAEVRNIRFLSDVIYLANLFAGGDRCWSTGEDLVPSREELQPYIDLATCPLPEIIGESRVEIDGLKAALA